jgi:DMSO/TMAO reductase YedYZ molybdopterin-dependent catalytic subunit
VAVSQLSAKVSGIVAAATALAVTEIVAAVGDSGPSLVASIAARVIDNTPGWMSHLAIDRLGTNDKPTLIVGIVVVCLLVGGGIGAIAAKHRAWGAIGVGLLAAGGLWLGLSAPLVDQARLWVAALLGAAAGIAVLLVLLKLAPPPVSIVEAREAPGATDIESDEEDYSRVRNAVDPRIKVASRRQFFGWAGGMSVASAAAVGVSKALRNAGHTSPVSGVTLPPVGAESLSTPVGESFNVPGLTPYVMPNKDFYRIDTAVFVPQVNSATWKMKIGGMVDHPFELTFDDLKSMDLVEEYVTLSCVSNAVGGDLVGNALWRGVPLHKLLERAGVKPGATQIVGRSVDGFTVGFPTEKATDGRTAMVAIGMNGDPLPVIHGFPARLVVSGLYGYVSATKWLQEIELTRWEAFDAYWVPLGWAKEGPVKTQSRIDYPRDRAKLAVGKNPIAGVAWAPTRGISKVEVRIDDGPWVEAQLGDVASKNTWVQWLVDWDANTPGKHYVYVRATDGNGEVQTDKRASPDPDGATGYHYRMVNVA